VSSDNRETPPVLEQATKLEDLFYRSTGMLEIIWGAESPETETRKVPCERCGILIPEMASSKVDLSVLRYAVYSGSEKVEYGDKRVSALCQSETQANVLIKGMWPESGYWEKL
jgi:hypothetical protein